MSRGALPWQLDTVVGSRARLLVGALRMVAVRPSRGLVLLLAGGLAVACMGLPPPTPTPAPPTPTPVPTATPLPYGTGPLRASGGKLVDAAGREVRLTGVNWSGLETGAFAPFGLWSHTIEETLDQIVAVGFNTLRLPYSNQLFEPGIRPGRIDFRKNPDLRGVSGLEIMDRVVEGARRRGLRVLLDRHQPTGDRRTELWYTDRVPEERWIRDWVMLARRYRGNEAVIGADLHNEPHSPATWGDGNPRTDWRLAAERAGNAILEANPDWLIVVEGVEDAEGGHYWWGGNLSAAGRAPVRLSRPDRLVYSAHDYGPDESQQVWFDSPDYPLNLPEVWRRNWAYLKLDGIAPVLVGEFGGRSVGDDPSGVWQRALLEYIEREGFSYTYWVWNQDDWVGGLVQDNAGRLNQAKLSLLARSQWPFLGQRQQIAPPSGP
jgi:endoglucanase